MVVVAGGFTSCGCPRMQLGLFFGPCSSFPDRLARGRDGDCSLLNLPDGLVLHQLIVDGKQEPGRRSSVKVDEGIEAVKNFTDQFLSSRARLTDVSTCNSSI